MERRRFLIRSVQGGSLLLILPAGWSATGCGGGGYGTTNATTGNSLQFTSSVVGGHSHDFSLDETALAQPPAAGLTGNTTTAAGHLHMVSLSEAELAQIEGGATVTKETSVASAHTHTFELKLSSAGTAGSSGTGGTTGQGGTTGTGGTTLPHTGGYP
jgi:hypothetical protein